MYIINRRSGLIVNSEYVMDYHLLDVSDATLLSEYYRGADKPRTLERYKTRKEAMDALELRRPSKRTQRQSGKAESEWAGNGQQQKSRSWCPSTTEPLFPSLQKNWGARRAQSKQKQLDTG